MKTSFKAYMANVKVGSVVLLHAKAEPPYKKYGGDAGYDLTIVEDTLLPPREFVDLHTGIAVKLPDGYFGRITGRSSTLRTWRVMVSEGIIDCDYVGELFIGAFNMNSHEILIPAGTRIAQIIVQEIVPVAWCVTNVLPETPRGSKGFGSTGKG